MKYALDSKMSKSVDAYTIENTGLDSIVLMERAALAVAKEAAYISCEMKNCPEIVAVCGTGNNGADGIACARILCWQGMPVDVILVGDEKKSTAEFRKQKEIAQKTGVRFVSEKEIGRYGIILDAIFGVGLKREVEGIQKDIIESINKSPAYVISVDVPSGMDAATGNTLGISVKADETVTFGYNKIGMMLPRGRVNAGKVIVADVGFYPEAIRELNPPMYFCREDIDNIPVRDAGANKGTYGKVLVIGGSKDMSGAAYFSASAAMRCGAGIVKLYTHKDNVSAIRTMLPEAIISGNSDEDSVGELKNLINSCDIIVIGPGLSQSDTARRLVEYTMVNATVPMIIDADGLNIISHNIQWLKNSGKTIIITPHIGEMARLTGLDREQIMKDPLKAAEDFAVENGVICVLKDCVTVVAEPDGHRRRYINTSGGPALAKGGSGDVLSGVIAGMLSLKIEPFSAASMGVYVHGIAGEQAAEKMSAHSVWPSDLLNEFGKILP